MAVHLAPEVGPLGTPARLICGFQFVMRRDENIRLSLQTFSLGEAGRVQWVSRETGRRGWVHGNTYTNICKIDNQ